MGRPVPGVCPSKVAVVGVGNLLMGDEGIGVQVIQALEQSPLPNGVALFDAGTAFQSLVGELAPFDKWIIVDAVNGGGRPGELYRLEWEDLLEGARESGTMQAFVPLSLHDLGVIETLLLEQLVAQASPSHRPVAMPEVIVLGIEPERIALSLELSPAVERQLPELLQVVREELERTPCLVPRKSDVHNCDEEEPS